MILFSFDCANSLESKFLLLKICQNTGFLRPVFSRKNLYSGIFYAVFASVPSVHTVPSVF